MKREGTGRILRREREKRKQDNTTSWREEKRENERNIVEIKSIPSRKEKN